MFERVRSVSFVAFFALSTVVYFFLVLLIWLVTAAFDRSRVAAHLFTAYWTTMYLWLMPAWSLTKEGRKNIRKGATYVVVSNHQSLLDILAAFQLYFPFKWVSKAEVFRMPFMGWGMALCGYVKLKRGDLHSVRQMLADSERTLAQGNSIYLFPEGTRSETGQMKRFKPGAFVLAKKMKVPILPIAITGTKDALPKNSLLIRGKHRIRIKVLPEIPYDAFADLSAAELTAMVQARIAAEVEGGNAVAHPEAAVEEG